MDAQTPFEVSSSQVEARPVFQQGGDSVAASSGPLSACAIQELLTQEWQRARGSRGQLAVVLVRSLNRGERGQAQHAAAILAELQPSARVGSYDRYALLIVCPQTRAESATQLARTLAVRLSGRGRIACGVAAHPEMASSPAELVSAAERAARRANGAEPVVVAPALPYVVEPRASFAAPVAGVLAEALPRWQAASAQAGAVLMLGEAGAGKQTIAQAMHLQSARKNGPFKVVHCSAIPEDAIASVLFATDRGAFADAKGGTLFLEDVAALSLAAQSLLVQTLETRTLPGAAQPLDVQCVASTHHDLGALCAQGRFRADLLQLLNAVKLEVPALRNRSEEILALAEHFVTGISAQWGAVAPRITEESRSLLADYAWPGNVSELRHVMERAVALAEDDSITPAEFPEHVRTAVAGESEPERVSLPRGFLDLRASLLDHEAMLIRQALQLTRGNQRKAASLLKLPLRTLERKLRNLGGRQRLMAS
jgi:transcriptional regulator of acetoin/glycerol metabolism